MTANDFQKAATEWVGAAVIVAGLVLNGYLTLKTKWDAATHKAEVDKQLALQGQQVEQNTARLNGQSAKIDTLMIAATPPTAPTLPTFVPVPIPTPEPMPTPCPEDGQKDNPNE